jgi:hypothetical protein
MNKNEQRRLRFKKRVGTMITRSKRTSTTGATLQTIQEQDELFVLEPPVHYGGEVKVDSNLSSVMVNFKKSVEDLLQDGTGTILITTHQRQELTGEINQDYTEILLEQRGEHMVDVHLGAATHVVNEFFAVQDIILAKARMPSSMQDVIFEVLQDFIYPRVSNHYSNKSIMDKLTPRDAAKIATWIDEFVDRMNKECPDLEIQQSWEQDREHLIQHYLDQSVRCKMNEVLTRARQLLSTQDVREESQGHLVTGFPEQVAFIYEQHLKVARDLLPCKYQEIILAACNQELAAFVGAMQLEIMIGWRQMSSSYFCALLNDASRLSEQCEERNNLILQRTEFKENGQDLVRDLTELSLDITRFLCEYIMHFLREPESILTSVGSIEWERNALPCAIDRTIATFEDFFADLEKWIFSSQYFFPKVLQNILQMTLQTYLESFFANTLTKGIQDPAQVARVLKRDHGRLKAFFHGSSICEAYHGSGGFHTQRVIKDRLSILQSLAAMVDPTMQPADIRDDIKAILSHFESGVSGAAVVLHLLGLRKRHRRLESIEWLKTIASTLKELDHNSAKGAGEEKHCDGKENDHTQMGSFSVAERSTSSSSSSFSACSFSVPDLRNSKFLHNIRPTRSEVPRRISAQSLPFADATLRLLQSRRVVVVHTAVVHRGIIRRLQQQQPRLFPPAASRN